MLFRGLSLTAEQMETIEECLDVVHHDTEARWVLLTDISGQFISARGLPNSMNTLNVEALSALAAGNLATTREMARLVGEKARFKLLLHEGDQRSVYLSDVDGEFVLVIAFDNSTPIGLVRLYTRRSIDRLRKILRQAKSTSSPQTADLGDDFGELLASEMDSFFESGGLQSGSDMDDTEMR